jgi:hypothetical protein
VREGDLSAATDVTNFYQLKDYGFARWERLCFISYEGGGVVLMKCICGCLYVHCMSETMTKIVESRPV